LEPVKNERQQLWQVASELRQKVVYRRLNLSSPPFPLRGPLDVIFCRNVMIYFDRDTRQALVDEFTRLLAPDGLLMVGHAESLSGIRTSLETVSPSVYRQR
jgi:chemotaxis protein methyltransferase CheR